MLVSLEDVYKIVCQEYKKDVAIAKMNNDIYIGDEFVKIGRMSIYVYKNFKGCFYKQRLIFIFNNKHLGDMEFSDKIDIKKFKEYYDKKCIIK